MIQPRRVRWAGHVTGTYEKFIQAFGGNIRKEQAALKIYAQGEYNIKKNMKEIGWDHVE